MPRAAEIAASMTPGTQVAPTDAALLTLVAHRSEIPAWQVSEVLGAETAKALAAVKLDADTLDVLRESLDTETIAEKLANAFDNDRREWLPKQPAADLGAVAVPVGATLIVPDAPGRAPGRDASPHHPSTLDPATPFLSHGRVEPTEGEGFPEAILEKGTVLGKPATRLTLHDRTFVTVQVGRATTWEEARAAARALGPAWDLPTEEDYFALTVGGAVDTRLVVGQTSWPDAARETAVYPLWVRGDQAKADAKYKGTSMLYTMQDGTGMDAQAMDAGPMGVAEYKALRAQLKEILRSGAYRTPAEQKRLAEALLAQNKKGGAILNPEIPHRELPADVNAIIQKPTKEKVLNALAAAERLIAAFEDGYPVYAARTYKRP
jgi:hypothetical protein